MYAIAHIKSFLVAQYIRLHILNVAAYFIRQVWAIRPNTIQGVKGLLYSTVEPTTALYYR